jgi:hypothetical protein
MRIFLALLGWCALSIAYGDEYPLDINSDIKAEYFVVEKSGTPEQPTLVMKRVRAGATSYSKRSFDCEAATARSLGSAESLADLSSAGDSGEMAPVTEGTIAYQLWQHACGR